MARKFGILILLISLVASGAVFAAWQTLTQLPEWYEQPPSKPDEETAILSPDDFDEPSERDQLEANLEEKLQPVIRRRSPSTNNAPSQVILNERDINDLIIVSANQSSQTRAYLDGVKGIKTKISEENIHTEIVINFSQINRDRLPEQQIQVLKELSSQFPLFANQDLLLSFDGQPQLQAGQLQLDPAMKVDIGGFQMTLATLFKRFGVDLNMTPVNLKISESNIQDVRYSDGSLIIRGKS